MIIDRNGRYMVVYKEKMESGEVLWNDETNNFNIILCTKCLALQ